MRPLDPVIVDLKITQMIKPYKTGSQPWLVKCNNDDREQYIVKFSNQDYSFANEFICYKIADKIGLTTTPSFAVKIEQKEVEIINRRKAQENEPLITEGKYFFSKYIEEPYTLNNERHNALLPTEIRNLEQVPGMIAFDIFVDNGDRKNENAIIHPIDKESTIFEYVPIDHGHCFSGPSWNADSIKSLQYNVKPIPWKTTEITNHCVFTPYIAALDLLDDSFFKKIIEEIPLEWKHDQKDFGALLTFLTSRDHNKVLNTILQHKNNKQLFPNWEEN